MMIKEKLLKKENRIVILTIALLGLFIVVGTSLALWNLTFRQASTNKINTSCFKIDFTENDDINMSNAYPLTDEEASNLSPYTFKITNICDTSATYQVNLEELEVEGKKLSNQYINLSLNEKVGNVSTFEEVDKTLDNATISHRLTTGVLKSKEEKSFELRLWLREDSPSTEEIMNASFLSKITVITVYKKNIPEVSSLAYENLDTIKVDVNTISNPDNEALTYYYQLDNNEEVKSNTRTHTFPKLQDGAYKIKVRVEDSNGIVIFEKEEDVVVAYVHVYISSTGNDTNGNGSPDSPYATLQRAYNKVKSGGEMILLSDITATSTTNMNIANKDMTLKSNGKNIYSIIRQSSNTSHMIVVSNSNTLTTENITLNGNNINASGSLIEARNSSLNLNTGTTIKNNIHIGNYNTDWKQNSSLGGGVYMYNGIVNINGATITNNKVNSSTNAQGGGIAVYHGTLNLNDGTISNNEQLGIGGGGGIFVGEGNFNMKGGRVIYNKADHYGGIKLNAYESNTIGIISGGSVTNNSANVTGGISCEGFGSYTVVLYIKGGTISNNLPSGSDYAPGNGSQIIDER